MFVTVGLGARSYGYVVEEDGLAVECERGYSTEDEALAAAEACIRARGGRA